MTQHSVFTSAAVGLLRAAAAPRRAGRAAAPSVPDGSVPDEGAWLRERLVALAGDEQLLEAVEAASPSLARDARAIAAGAPAKAKDVRRAVIALTKYHLRLTGRATPFGLFAGVAPVRFGAHPALRAGDRHRAVSRPDAAWLDALVGRVRTVPAVLARTSVVAAPVRSVRDGRLLLPARTAEPGGRRGEASIRFTPIVSAALDAATTPIRWPELLAGLGRRFGVEPGKLEPVLCRLVELGALLTDLDPPADCTDPLGHVLAAGGDAHGLFGQLRGIDTDLRAGVRVTDRMRRLHEGADASPVQTDLRLDADLTLPDEVAREAERAATVLWRLSAPVAAPWLPRYHERFLERYGTERAVPVTELLGGTGLGLPRWDEAPSGTGADDERTPVLAAELLAAVRERRAEIVLDDALVERLAADEPAPPSMELCAEVLADGWDGLCAGEFRLVVGQSLGSALAGTTVARFAHLLPELDAELTELVRAGAPADGVRAAQVAFRPLVARSANVAAVPQRLPLRVPLAPGTVDASVTDLPLDRLAVTATTERLHLVDVATGARIAPVSGSMLNPRSGHVPPVARFLLELGGQDTPQCQPWSWGVLAAVPYLPRVRHGRTVLAPARWSPARELSDAALPAAQWVRCLAEWRERWDVPRHVRLTVADNHIPVDLDDPLHQLVFRDELRRHPQLVVLETPADAGWLGGAHGTHTCEVVFQLLGTRAEEPVPAVARPVPQRGADLLQLPGGDWLYAKLYATEPAQRAVLRSRLPELVDEAGLSAAGIDGWFFVRYSDPEPHLRLRFHGKPDGLWGELLPRLHSWTTRLRHDGLLSTAVLDSYDPEVERYGGPEAMVDAERVFHADSALALALTPHLGGDDADVRAATSVHDLLVGFDPSGTALARFAAAVPVADRRAVPAVRRGQLADVLPAPGGRLVAPGGFRRGALAAYAATLDRTGCPPDRRAYIAASLAHMHCNRLFGVDRDRERGVYALLHRALAVRANRARYGR